MILVHKKNNVFVFYQRVFYTFTVTKIQLLIILVLLIIVIVTALQLIYDTYYHEEAEILHIIITTCLKTIISLQNSLFSISPRP